MPDKPKEPEKRRSWIRVNIDRSTSFKTTLFKFAPSLRIGTLFGSPLRAAITTALIIGGPAAAIMAAETTGATDLLDQDPQVVHITVIADETGRVTVASDPAAQAVTVFDELMAAIEAIADPAVTVTVAAVSPEVAQFLTQIGTILDRLPTFFGDTNAELAALVTGQAILLAAIATHNHEPPPVDPPGLTVEQADAIIDALEEVVDSQDLIEDAIFPGRGRCTDCPEVIVAE